MNAKKRDSPQSAPTPVSVLFPLNMTAGVAFFILNDQSVRVQLLVEFPYRLKWTFDDRVRPFMLLPIIAEGHRPIYLEGLS